MKWKSVSEEFPKENGAYLCYVNDPKGKECKEDYIYIVVNYNDKIGFRTAWSYSARVLFWCELVPPTSTQQTQCGN